MQLLFITDIAPFPVKGGEKLRTYGLLKIFSELGFETHAIIGKTENTDYSGYKLKNTHFTEFDFTKLISKKQYIDYFRLFRRNIELESKINYIIDNNTIDFAFIDYHYYGHYINYIKRRNIKVIYGTHNAQAELYKKLPVKTFRERLSRSMGFFVRQIHERIYFNNADAFITVSEEDKNYHAKFVRKDKLYVIPNFLHEDDYTPLITEKKKNYIVMTGNFHAMQNKVGLEWFLKNIWNEKLHQKTKLILAGLNSKIVHDNLSIKYNTKNVEALGELDDLKPVIANAKASIVPLLDGSGTRLKCIESMALKTQLISTTVGAEGIQYEDSILIADTPEEFRQNILNVLNNKTNNTEKAYNIFLNKYSFIPNVNTFKRIIKNLQN